MVGTIFLGILYDLGQRTVYEKEVGFFRLTSNIVHLRLYQSFRAYPLAYGFGLSCDTRRNMYFVTLEHEFLHLHC